MRLYETGFIISPKLSDEERENFIQQMIDVVAKKKGRMLKENKWGRRKLAYPIRKFEEGFYVFFLYEGEPEVPSELERLFKQADGVLRFLTVKKDERENIRKKPGFQEEIAEESAEKEPEAVEEKEKKGEESLPPEERKEESPEKGEKKKEVR